MYIVNSIRLPIESSKEEALAQAAKHSGLPLSQAFILRRAVDARRTVPVFVYSVGFDVPDRGEVTAAVWQDEYTLPKPTGRQRMDGRPIIVGFGPAGMFCALALAERGYCPIVLERGADVETRQKALEKFFATGELDPNTNVQFGEGGAGTFSDGKLGTRIGDMRCRWILKRFVEFGSPERILWQAKPHVGTDLLCLIVKRIRERIEELGGEVIFCATLTGIDRIGGSVSGVRVGGVEKIKSDCVVLATGHSARDIYELTAKLELPMAAKPFSVGVRIEHLQDDIDSSLYKGYAGHPLLGAAEYTYSLRKGERGVYNFCMCPGGEVIAAASEIGGVVTNGMSNSARAGVNGNAALCVSVLPQDFGGDLFGGVRLQRQLEQAAFGVSNSYHAPAQMVKDYMAGVKTAQFGRVKPTYSAGVVPCDLNGILPSFVNEYLRFGLKNFVLQGRFYADGEAVLTGVETRTSAPIRIERNEQMVAAVLDGLYPCGEGAGYAGGIMSAAADGLAVAEQIMKRYEAI